MKLQYVVLDLEMCQVNGCDSKRYPHKNEIIQIGAVKMNEQFEIIDEFNYYVRPEFGVISKYIQNLTGIYNGKVKNAAVLKDILPSFVSWCGTEDVKYVAWSETDYSQIQKEIFTKKIDFSGIQKFMNPDNWIDYQKEFGIRYHFENPMKLTEALTLADIEFEGHCHDGLCDAYNTARLFATLEQDSEYQLISERVSEYKDPEEIGFSLGEILMSKFNLSFAS